MATAKDARYRKIERARDAAQRSTYEINDLVSAALAINGSAGMDADSRIEAVLSAARAKLTALSEAIEGGAA